MHDNEKNEATEEALKSSLGKLNAFYFNAEIKDDARIPQDVHEMSPVEQKIALPRRRKRKIKYWMLIAVAAVLVGIIAIGITWFAKNQETSPSIAGSEKPDTGKAKTDTLQEKNPTGLAVQNNADSTVNKKQPQIKTTKKQEELFAANFEPDEAPAITEGPLEDAFTFYVDKNYSDAAQEFSSANLTSGTRGLETDSQRIAFYADYYAGISYLEQADNINAMLKLESAVTKSPDELFRVKATWYLALTYLKTGELTKASKLLIKISENKEEIVYKSKAARLLTALK
jgi:hypothetical protein